MFDYPGGERKQSGLTPPFRKASNEARSLTIRWPRPPAHEGGSCRMAESSATPLPRKLGIKPGQRLAFVNIPPGFLSAVGPLPQAATLVRDWRQEDGLDVIVF